MCENPRVLVPLSGCACRVFVPCSVMSLAASKRAAAKVTHPPQFWRICVTCLCVNAYVIVCRLCVFRCSVMSLAASKRANVQVTHPPKSLSHSSLEELPDSRVFVPVVCLSPAV
jgi:hypothetical protein